MQARLGGVVGGILAMGFVVTIAPSLRAQTWPGGTTPAVTQIFAIDRTGESGWLYGEEDVAGDGTTFQQQEQSIDIRTAYAATDASRFWARVYVSDVANAGGNVIAYIFIDNDKSSSTGGTAAATVIDPKFTSDPTSGGYEFAVGVQGNQSVVGVWQYTSDWAEVNIQANQAAAEAGTDLDPIRVNGDSHGYLQAMVDLSVVGLTTACDANLYVRTTNSTPQLGEGDLNVGDKASACAATAPIDSNQNGVPDPIEAASGCTDNAQCPNGGVCVNGECRFAAACSTDADCPSADYQCTSGRCVLRPTGSCSDSSECNGLVCSGGQCVACTTNDQCGTDGVCGPDGRCTGADDAIDLDEQEDLQGGACACGVPGAPAGSAIGLLLAFPALLGWRLVTRSKRRRERRPSSHPDR